MKYLILAITMIATQPALAWVGSADSTHGAHGANVGQFLQPIAPPPPPPPAPAGSVDQATIDWLKNNCVTKVIDFSGAYGEMHFFRIECKGPNEDSFSFRNRVRPPNPNNN